MQTKKLMVLAVLAELGAGLVYGQSDVAQRIAAVEACLPPPVIVKGGAAVMTNAQGGSRPAHEVMSAIAAAYNWPDWRPVERTEVKVDPAVLARYVGTYQLAPNFRVTFTLEGDQLMTQATNQPKFPVYPESQTKFFLEVVDAEAEFVSDEKGQVNAVILHQGGQDHKGVRK